MRNNLTIPNIITAFRIVLVPIFVLLYFGKSENHFLYAFILVAVSAVSDIVDGFIARRFNMISDLGKLLDPFADKLTQLTLALCLTFRHNLLMPVLIVLATKELLTAVAAAFLLSGGMKPVSSRWWGKLSTLFLYATFMYYILSDVCAFEIVALNFALTVLTIAFMLLSMCGYIKLFLIKTDKQK